MASVALELNLRNSPRLWGSDPKLSPGNSSHCKCAGCGFYFKSVRAFERHRYGLATKRRCMARPRMRDAGLALDARGYWRLPLRPMTVRDKLRLRSKNAGQ